METSALRKQLEAEGVQTRQDKYAAATTPLPPDARPIVAAVWRMSVQSLAELCLAQTMLCGQLSTCDCRVLA